LTGMATKPNEMVKEAIERGCVAMTQDVGLDSARQCAPTITIRF
jgi:hypothetical protein